MASMKIRHRNPRLGGMDFGGNGTWWRSIVPGIDLGVKLRRRFVDRCLIRERPEFRLRRERMGISRRKFKGKPYTERGSKRLRHRKGLETESSRAEGEKKVQ